MGSGVLHVSTPCCSPGRTATDTELIRPLGPIRADYVNDEDIQDIIQWKSPYDPSNSAGKIEFTEEENEDILRLPRKECG